MPIANRALLDKKIATSRHTIAFCLKCLNHSPKERRLIRSCQHKGNERWHPVWEDVAVPPPPTGTLDARTIVVLILPLDGKKRLKKAGTKHSASSVPEGCLKGGLTVKLKKAVPWHSRCALRRVSHKVNKARRLSEESTNALSYDTDGYKNSRNHRWKLRDLV